MRASWALAASTLAVLAGACTRDDGPARANVAPGIVMPRGLLQSVASVSIAEYFAGPASCDASSGVVSNAPSPDASTTLSQSGCTGGAVWCGSMQVTTSGAPRIFSAQAQDGSKNVVALGCVQATVDQQTQPITILMKRPIPQAQCGDGVLQPTEQCDPPGAAADLTCGADCQTKEELFSEVNATSGVPGPGKANVGDRADPFLLWPSGAWPAGRFVAFWDDKTQPPNRHVGLRVLGDDLDALPSKDAPALAGGSVWLTSAPNTFPSNPDAENQVLPSAAYAADAKRYFVAFADDSGGSDDVYLRTLDANFDAEQSAPIGINGTQGGGEAGVQTNPALALGANDVAYVAWQSAPQVGPGQIVGRTYNLATQTYGAQVVLSSGSANESPSVAALPTGWVVVWQSGSDVVMRTVGPNGAPTAAASVVSAGHNGVQDHPAVASLGGGDARFAVAWADHGQNGADIVVQRYDATGAPVPGDSTTPINDLVADGDQVTPAIAGSATNAFFAVAWIDTPSGHVRARLLDASSGFDFNNVDGQNDEFQASVADGRTRVSPSVAIGGSGPFIAIGWADTTTGDPGIYGRRFPLPP